MLCLRALCHQVSPRRSARRIREARRPSCRGRQLRHSPRTPSSGLHSSHADPVRSLSHTASSRSNHFQLRLSSYAPCGCPPARLSSLFAAQSAPQSAILFVAGSCRPRQCGPRARAKRTAAAVLRPVAAVATPEAARGATGMEGRPRTPLPWRRPPFRPKTRNKTNKLARLSLGIPIRWFTQLGSRPWPHTHPP